MFYSQFILAKKGPLGTIWIAAHLERRLKRTQVNETNITTSVDSILFPDVPIALRLSGHLLLGVVRIFSRKVTYLFQDCNEALQKLKTAFTAQNNPKSAAIDLPADVAVAPLHLITLPEDFFEFEDSEPAVNFVEESFDHHVCSREKITLDEPVVEEEDLGFRFPREEIFSSSSFGMDAENQDFPSSSAPPELQEDVLPPMDLDAGLDDIDAFPSVEKLRSAPEVPEDDPSDKNQEYTIQPEPEVVIEPVTIEVLVPEDNHLVEDEQSIPSTPSTRPEVASPDATPALAVVETPASERKKGASRKRKELIDEQLTLSESYMKNMLNDPSDIRRVRRKVANTPQLICMFEKEVLGKRMFNKPSAVNGLCPGLAELYEEAYNPNPKRQKTSAASTVNVTLVPDDGSPSRAQAPGSPSRAQAPASPAPVPETPPAMKTPEQVASDKLRDDQTEGYTPRTPVQEFGTAADITDATPAEQNLEARAETCEPTPSTAERPSPAQNVEIPVPEVEVEAGANINKGPAIESSFLGDSSSEGSQTAEGWSSRTRAIAQFLHTTFEQGSSEVSVTGLLRSKTRREAARMFFETLVLATNDYVSVEQSKPYEDVTLHARPKLIKAVF